MSAKKIPVSKGLKYLGLALPLLFGAPIVVTIGFKALARDNSYLILVVGILLAILAMLVTAKGVTTIMKSLFQKDEE
ncbi:MAG: hypothetical protein HKN90_06595 [Flavobacteriaceae bacterium]|nr:hypothetical protein [Flavobacteriaceae bacterium]